MKVLIVDDEAPARRRLRRMLDQLGGIELVGEADGGLSALREIERLQPDLLLLDIEMPDLDGMALAARYAHLPPVVFVTAHDEYAVRAFEANAIDYLLKPVRAERLAEALKRAQARTRSAAESFGALPPIGKSEIPRVVTHERETIRFFDARTITRFWASEKYTLFFADNKEHLTEEPLSALAERLAPWGFFRVHRAELIRITAVRALTSGDGIHEVRMEDGQIARVSRRLVGLLKKELGL
jgi:DNA-binding LytR/AlgR family response regulator